MSGECHRKRRVSGRDAGLKPYTYMGEKKNCSRNRNRAKGKAIGWIATRTWDRVASRWRTGKVFYMEW